MLVKVKLDGWKWMKIWLSGFKYKEIGIQELLLSLKPFRSSNRCVNSLKIIEIEPNF